MYLYLYLYGLCILQTYSNGVHKFITYLLPFAINASVWVV